MGILYKNYTRPFIKGDVIEVTKGNLTGCQGIISNCRPYESNKNVNVCVAETWCGGELFNLQYIWPYEMKHISKFNDINFKAYNEFHQ